MAGNKNSGRKPIPEENKSVQTGLRIPANIHVKLKQESKEENVPIHKLIFKILADRYEIEFY